MSCRLYDTHFFPVNYALKKKYEKKIKDKAKGTYQNAFRNESELPMPRGEQAAGDIAQSGAGRHCAKENAEPQRALGQWRDVIDTGRGETGK
jgi:hypothetical protein